MNLINIRFVIAAVLVMLILIVGILIRLKSHLPIKTTPSIQITEVREPEPTSGYKEPESLPFDFRGKESSEISPFDIAKFARAHPREYVSFKKLWQELGIESEDWRMYSNCHVQNFRVSLDNDSDQEILQMLYDKLSGWSAGGTRYLLWKRLRGKEGNKWKLLGHLDFEGQRYSEPSHRVFNIKGRRFLLIDCMTVHGSGVGAYDEVWYELRPDGLLEVLRYPSSCFSMGGTETETQSRIRRAYVISGRVKVQIEFTDRYTLRGVNDRVLKRWYERRRAAFIWSKPANRFIFDRRYSSISKKDFEATCNY